MNSDAGFLPLVKKRSYFFCVSHSFSFLKNCEQRNCKELNTLCFSIVYLYHTYQHSNSPRISKQQSNVPPPPKRHTHTQRGRERERERSYYLQHPLAGKSEELFQSAILVLVR